MVFRGLFPSLPWKQTAKQNLVISVVILVALGIWGGPLGWQMGDVPLQEGDGVGQNQGTYQVTDFRWLFSSLPMKTAAKWDLDISVVFLVTLGLWGEPLGWRMGDVPPQEGHGVGRIIFELFGAGVNFLLMKNAKPDACERINTYRLTS